MEKATIIIPLYGNHESKNNIYYVTEKWLSQSFPCEVIIAIAGNVEVEVAGSSDPERNVKIVRLGEEEKSPARLRNVAAMHSRSQWLYLSDADIFPIGNRYLENAIDLARRGIFCQPWMRRLIPNGKEIPSSIHAGPQGTNFCYSMLDEYGNLVKIDGEIISWKEMQVGNKDMIIPTVVPPSAAQDIIGPKRRRQPSFHWGGALMKRNIFFDIGGYCERYFGWGGEDDDLLIKASRENRIIYGWKMAPTLLCGHFEHEYPYDGTSELQNNRTLLKKRVKMGAERMIAEDRIRMRDF